MARLTSLDHKIWGIAWPAILSNISIPLLGLVDAAILGHLGSPHYLGAVAIGAALLSFLYWGFGFLRMGTTGLVARATGAGQDEEARLILARSCLLALGLALLVLALHPLLLGLGFSIMAPREELLALARDYAGIRIFSAPAVLVTYAIVGWFIGRQDTRWPMVIVVITNGVNIILDVVFIIGFGMNSDGAALATLIAEYLGCALALWAVARQSGRHLFSGLADRLLLWREYASLLKNNRHLFMRTLLLLFSFAFFTAMGEKLGEAELAANSLLMQLVLLAAYGMDGFAFAAEGLSGQSLGARDLPGFYRAVKRCGMWSLISAALLSLFFLLFNQPLFTLLTSITQLQSLMADCLPWLVLLPLVAAPSYWLDGVFIGAAETRYMMLTMVFSVLLVYLPGWYFTRDFGIHGLWFAFTAFNAARGLSLYICYLLLSRNGQWLRGEFSTKATQG